MLHQLEDEMDNSEALSVVLSHHWKTIADNPQLSGYAYWLAWVVDGGSSQNPYKIGTLAYRDFCAGWDSFARIKQTVRWKIRWLKNVCEGVDRAIASVPDRQKAVDLTDDDVYGLVTN